jgi:UDP-N-acetylmuramate: L-alanyl-gamma-D-glutamyl-meso-diaminopimelate ligase
VRTVPGNGLIVQNADEPALQEVIDMGCWTGREYFSAGAESGWGIAGHKDDTGDFDVLLDRRVLGRANLALPGRHNQMNALAAIAAARHAGVPVNVALDALARFDGVKRRMELRGDVNGVKVFDDFAHHPTAIRLSIRALRNLVGDKRIFAVLEPRSNTMRMGVHREQLVPSLVDADQVFLFQPADAQWSVNEIAERMGARAGGYDNIDQLADALVKQAQSGDSILIMSNGGFGNIHQKILDRLS